MDQFKKIISLTLCLQISFAFSLESVTEPSAGSYNLQEITLPSEVKDLPKATGTIFYNTSVKNKILLPTNFWGEVQRPGLHFIPSDTSLIKGISMAGGPSGAANLNEILLIRKKINGELEQHKFDLANGGNTDAHNFQLEPGDSIFVKKDRFYENRAYYTGLVGIAVSLLSGVFIYQRIQKN